MVLLSSRVYSQGETKKNCTGRVNFSNLVLSLKSTLTTKKVCKTQTKIKGFGDHHCDYFPFVINITPISAVLAHT